ncbi:MAG: acylphosphatase [Saprospiraceae bacterium]|jgi:acylphosphatase
MTKRISIQVMGKVQGVYFRRDTQIEAQRLGLSGSVKNLPDSSVFIEAEGSDEKLEEFVKWCTQGPELANVSEILVSELSLKEDTSFEVLAKKEDFLS